MCLQIIYSHEKSFDADQFVEIKSLGFFHDDKTPVCSLKVIDLSYLTNYSFNEKFCFCLKKKIQSQVGSISTSGQGDTLHFIESDTLLFNLNKNLFA